MVPLAGGETDDTRIQAQVFLPASVGEPPAESRLAFLVRDKDGKDAARFEEATAFEPAAGGRFASRWFSVPPGDYTLAAGVFDTTGKLLAAAKKAVTVAAAPTDFAISPLVIAASVLPGRQPAPGGRLHVLGPPFRREGRAPRPAGRPHVRRARLQPGGRPGHEDREPVAHREAQAEGRARNGPPAAPGPADSRRPTARRVARGILTVDVSAILIETRLGDYLKKPGEYEIKVAVTDNVSKKSAESSGTFFVTGTLPAKK